ncbi:MAG TPA: PAS domain-containing sensor histidine kinase [Longimicrobium sp.]|nr:PAS domain-containing sensor histidine kinase [Longimicrobium sp.]
MADQVPPGDALDRKLVDSLVDEALLMLDGRGAVLRSNTGARALYGHPPGERVDLSQLYAPEDAAMGAHGRELREAEARGGVTRECWQSRADGTRFYAQVTTTALRDTNGRLEGYARHARDVTERLRHEEALRRSEQRFHGIVDLASEAIVSVDEDQRIVLFNRGAERIFGYGAAEIAGEPLARLVPEAQRGAHAAQVAAFAATGATARPMGARAEVRGVRKSGEEFPAEASISVMRDEAGQRVFTAVLRDVSARRAAEREIERLLQAEHVARERAEQALRARSELLGVVAHDFGNALTAVGFHAFELSDSLRARAMPDEGARADVILSMIEHMARLQRDLVDSAALEAGQLTIFPEKIDARQVLERAVGLYAQSAASRRVRLRLDAPAEPLTVLADADRMLQAVGNLLSNAIRHSPADGTVTVSAKSRDDVVVLSVADEGAGIGSEDVAHVFEPFWRGGAHAGTGLGLSIAQGIAKSHGGSLAVTSHPGHGAVLTLSLPLASRPGIPPREDRAGEDRAGDALASAPEPSASAGSSTAPAL